MSAPPFPRKDLPKELQRGFLPLARKTSFVLKETIANSVTRSTSARGGCSLSLLECLEFPSS